MTLKPDNKTQDREDGHLSWKMKRLGRVLKDAAMATIVMPLALIGVAFALASLMALIW